MSQIGFLKAGKLIQQVRTSTTAYTSTNAVIPLDDTIPQITEGAQLFSLAITPTSASNILLFECITPVTASIDSSVIIALFEGATANALVAITHDTVSTNATVTNSFIYYKTAPSTSSITYTLRYGAIVAPQIVYLNGGTGGRFLGGASAATLLISEIKP